MGNVADSLSKKHRRALKSKKSKIARMRRQTVELKTQMQENDSVIAERMQRISEMQSKLEASEEDARSIRERREAMFALRRGNRALEMEHKEELQAVRDAQKKQRV